ncbi:hypothetical protein L3556_02910 [Candidatus Synechococcus calcipolaris G9]|uniref:Dual OB-containing domain-containing protein n=1 Tax=Candidatus Synechococcus calcipolaris G9 TaxID=1497997 RepID=A0ABT6EVS2_9SYNE|nr:hypothetical protein [Candidatus Synechococcus calcipolaris]MDG2989889.1 hypothetical protein [Candidatus Synechococcus calcipolaris G9]
MPSLKRIVCLANSWKLEERCIAGIDLDTGKWIRPVCDRLYPEDGRVPISVRIVEGQEPKLLDILQVPLAETGNDFGFECENRSILDGQWQYLGQAQPTDLLRYCSSSKHILHNSSKYVYPSYLKKLPFPQRRTLQLVEVVNFSVEKRTSSKGNIEWRGTIEASNGRCLAGAKITDPVFVEKLKTGYQPKDICFVTVSLGMPWGPPDWDGEYPCWKLIAGVIEISSKDV